MTTAVHPPPVPSDDPDPADAPRLATEPPAEPPADRLESRSSDGPGTDEPPPLDQSPHHPLDRFSREFREAVEACRVDNWRRGYEILTELAQQTAPKQVMPGVFYTYLGVAVARIGGQRHEGMELVRYGLRLQPREPDNYCNMALLCVTLGRRSEALRWLHKGLRRAPYHQRLNELREELGVRRRPPLPFLDRTHPLNVMLGQATWRWHRWRRDRDEEKAEEHELRDDLTDLRPAGRA